MSLNTQALIRTLEEHGFLVGEAEGGAELTIACPLCFDERRRLYIASSSGLWICFRCQARGHLRRLLSDVCEMTINMAVSVERSLWGGAKHHPVPAQPSPRPGPATVTMPVGMIQDEGNGIATDYFNSRGLKSHWVQDYGVGYCLTGYYRHRVIIPVYTEGELRTFVARTWLDDGHKKVLMPAGSAASHALFGYDRPDIAFTKLDGHMEVILVEGVFDAFRMWELGHTDTLATLGAHTTDAQRRLLKRIGFQRVVLMRDADEAGLQASIEEARTMTAALMKVSIAALPQGTDPGTAEPRDIQRALDTAVPCEQNLGTVETLKEVYQ